LHLSDNPNKFLKKSVSRIVRISLPCDAKTLARWASNDNLNGGSGSLIWGFVLANISAKNFSVRKVETMGLGGNLNKLDCRNDPEPCILEA